MESTFDIERSIAQIKPILDDLQEDSNSVGRGQLISLNKLQLSIIEELQKQICVLTSQSYGYSKLKEDLKMNLRDLETLRRKNESLQRQLLEKTAFITNFSVEIESLKLENKDLLAKAAKYEKEKNLIENELIELEKDYFNLLELIAQ